MKGSVPAAADTGSEEVKLDYRLKLLQILEAIMATEGTFFTIEWRDYGVTKEEEDWILREYDEYYRNKKPR